MKPVSLIIGFVPLVVFSLLVGHIPVGAAAVIGAACALAACAVQARHAVPVLPSVQVAALAAVAVAAFAGDAATRHFLVDYGRGLVSLALAAFILLTAGFAPFTAAFARASVPRERWHSPQFISLNRRISLAWGAAVAVLGLSHLLSGLLAASMPQRQSLLLDWGPTIIAVIVALRYTRRTVAEAQAGAPAPAPADQPGFPGEGRHAG